MQPLTFTEKIFSSIFFRVWFFFRNTILENIFRVFAPKNKSEEIVLLDFFLDQLAEETKNLFPMKLHPKFSKNRIDEKEEIAPAGINSPSKRIFFTSSDFSAQTVAQKIYEIILLLIFSGKNITTLTSVRGIFTSGALTNRVSENVKTVGGFVSANEKNIEQKMAQAISHMVQSSAKSSTWIMRKDFSEKLFGEKELPILYMGQPVICREEENFLSKEFPAVLIDFPKGYVISIKSGAVKKTKNGFEFWIEIYGNILNSSAMKSVKMQKSAV